MLLPGIVASSVSNIPDPPTGYDAYNGVILIGDNGSNLYGFNTNTPPNEHGDLVLLEVAARIEGGTSFSWLNGVNLPLLALYDALGYEYDIKENDYGLEMDRTLWHYRYAINYDFNHVYLRFENSLILRDRLNYKLMSLIYKFQSMGKKISLIIDFPRCNMKSVEKLLSEYDIPMSLFGKFIEFQNDIPISNMIKHPKSIYIDASFFDRNQVAGNKNIPVFDINQAIELFLN